MTRGRYFLAEIPAPSFDIIVFFAGQIIIGCDGLWQCQKQIGGFLLKWSTRSDKRAKEPRPTLVLSKFTMTKIRFLLRVQEAQADHSKTL
jgi:hypothetical protein